MRSAPEDLHRPYGDISNLKQTSNVRTYLTEFEQLQGLCDALLDQFLLEKFIDGIKEEIRYDVLALHPVEVREAVHLAKIFECKRASKKKNKLSNLSRSRA